MGKSHVSMEQKYCIVCAKKFDTGAILLDRRLKESMEMHTVTGMDLCPDCEKLEKQGFIAFVEIDPEKTPVTPEGKTMSNEWYRLGRTAHVKREAASAIFPFLKQEDLHFPALPVDSQLMDHLEGMYQESQKQ